MLGRIIFWTCLVIVLAAFAIGWSLLHGAIEQSTRSWEKEQLCIAKQLQLGAHEIVAKRFCAQQVAVM